MRFSLTIFALLFLAHVKFVQSTEYGVDCSFPVHSKEWKCDDTKLGNRTKMYHDFMEGCRKTYGKQGFRCDITEDDRLQMSVRQPQSMINYTNTGFMKIRAPKDLYELLVNHWNMNRKNEINENWGAGNTYVNHWESPTTMTG